MFLKKKRSNDWDKFIFVSSNGRELGKINNKTKTLMNHLQKCFSSADLTNLVK